MLRKPLFGAIYLAGLLAGILACGRPKIVDTTALSGVALPTPLARPNFTLPDTYGRQYNFANETKGKLTLLFFGYTHCPDVCPVHLANIVAAMNTLGYSDRQKIRVVFVTADPARDSAPVVRRWLDTFNPAFVGLIGTQAQADAAQRAAGVSPAERGAKQRDGSYAVGHAGQVIVFNRDDTARVVYPFGTRQTQWVHDLPLLLNQYLPASQTHDAVEDHTPRVSLRHHTPRNRGV